ncbi:hypothetical protein G6L99_31595 [Agrobacterium rhizogenes]|uniref:hypothetical protein n=1 Tax=Rhizobium rhizogenes TaxID=359 RepID=UPI0015724D7C|nr:hypothetical protein [Rhizobium rhizogenes]NTH16659.1 hypothetical protein [Rhizobium rhizogenes]
MGALTKADVIDCFDRRDRSYRLALLCTHWLRGGIQYKPSAAEEAHALQMEVRGEWISFSDLGSEIEQAELRANLVTEFALTHLYALICPPFEFLSKFCKNYGEANPHSTLSSDLKAAQWYQFARLVRNALSHNFRFEFDRGTRMKLPITWNGITISEAMDGQPISYMTLWHKTGYELFLEMKIFANSLPAKA